MHKTITELAEQVNGTVIGDGAVVISGISKIEDSHPETVTFLANQKYEKYLHDTEATAVLVPRSISESNTNLIQVDDPYGSFRVIALLFHPIPKVERHFIHPSAIINKNVSITEPVNIGAFVHIDESAVIKKNTSIGSHSYIGVNAKIGESVFLHPKVNVLERCLIGNRVILHAGVVIGSDGFGYSKENNCYLKIPQTGNVVVDDDVEIGANTTIDRATIGSTYIGVGCKIDNLVQIAHNVIIGDHTAIAAQTGISGSTKIGNHVTLAGQTGIVGHIEIGDNTIIGAQSGVSKSVPPNSFYFGYPARNHREAKKLEVYIRRLPELFDRLKELESRFKS